MADFDRFFNPGPLKELVVARKKRRLNYTSVMVVAPYVRLSEEDKVWFAENRANTTASWHVLDTSF